MPFAVETARVLEHVRLARDTFRIRLECPQIASSIRPGQFVMLRLPASNDPLLGRPFALYDAIFDGDRPIAVDVVYLVVGKMTSLLPMTQPGEKIDVWGPLGNGFPEPATDGSVALVAGGIGQTPFLAHIRELLGERGYGGRPAKRYAKQVSLYYGVRTADLAAGVEDFRSAGAEIHLASDDGSIGRKGYVTDLLAEHSAPGHIFGCGPEPMLHALIKQADARGVPCHVSLETPMACGIGICFSCVVPIKTDDGWDYKRVCVEGPVFDAQTIAW